MLDQSISSTLTHELNLDPYSNTKNIRPKNPNRLIIAKLNISSLRYKFDSLVEILHCNIDIVLISGTKIDGQVNSPELPETPEIKEITEKFTKVTKYLTKFKETLINYVWEKSHVKKQ